VDERSLHAPIACGNITSIAYALSAIGQKTSVDDIFHTAQLPLRAVTDGNMTLADTFHTAVEIVQIRQLPVKVNTPPQRFKEARRRRILAIRLLFTPWSWWCSIRQLPVNVNTRFFARVTQGNVFRAELERGELAHPSFGVLQ
jgi:hypothetical protein